ncbi:MAG: glycosyltransferase family 4 protein [Verrucomicrobia bacterium]|nr:glycosyltransferase family 4 protein [Verrucomicrobiota bacterium]
MGAIRQEARDGVEVARPAVEAGPGSDPHKRDFPRTCTPPFSAKSSRIAVLTAGRDRPYALGLAASLISQGVTFDFIGSDELDTPELRRSPQVRFLNLRGDMRPDTSALKKVARVLAYYGRLLGYAATARPKVFHILWNNKLELLDRTFVMFYYRLLGKRIAFTIHNVNIKWRDGNDTVMNRLTLKIQYHLADHLFVHTQQMRQELRSNFGVPDQKISVIPFGINSTVPDTALTSAEAKARLGLTGREKAVLFFGNIAPYKGLEYLVEAMAVLARTERDYRLIIAGRPKNCPDYWAEIRQRIARAGLDPWLIERIEYVPDADTELYFKAADVLVLPYTYIFQSGVLFLGYNFGLPVIASDVGSLKEDIIEGKTGLVCKSQDAAQLADRIKTYFASDLYRQLAARRPEIQAFAKEKYSWTKVGEITTEVYRTLRTGR